MAARKANVQAAQRVEMTKQCIHALTHLYTYVCMYVCMDVCMHVCMYACIYACMHECSMHVLRHFTVIYIYICINKQAGK